MEPQIKTSRSGNKVLLVPYQGNRFNEAIDEAERHFNVKDDASMTVIAVPFRNEICQPCQPIVN